jgi:S-formylglutathione hydrolase
MQTRSERACFGGRIRFLSHQSEATGTEMRLAAFIPARALGSERRPALYYLAGLECTEETFLTKAGAQRLASELGIVLIAPDTSPRGAGIPGEDADWDFGTGAGFYLDAAQEPWSRHYRMASYVSHELPALVEAHLPVQPGLRGVMGHSMGGHGAIVSALRNPGQWRSLSALAPIANPVTVPWGEKAFTNYLGADRAAWAEWDSCELMRRSAFPGPVLVDIGTADPFYEKQLRPEALEAAAKASGQALTLRRHEGYDHSYWFIQTVIDDHMRWHARELGA